MSSSDKKPSVSPQNKASLLLGKYDIGDVRLTEAAASYVMQAQAYANDIFSYDYVFDFNGRDTVRMNPVFGNKYFGDTIFRYTLIKNTLSLTNRVKKFTIPIVYDDGMYRLTINRNEIEGISIVNLKDLPKRNPGISGN